MYGNKSRVYKNIVEIIFINCNETKENLLININTLLKATNHKCNNLLIQGPALEV